MVFSKRHFHLLKINFQHFTSAKKIETPLSLAAFLIITRGDPRVCRRQTVCMTLSLCTVVATTIHSHKHTSCCTMYIPEGTWFRFGTAHSAFKAINSWPLSVKTSGPLGPFINRFQWRVHFVRAEMLFIASEIGVARCRAFVETTSLTCCKLRAAAAV